MSITPIWESGWELGNTVSELTSSASNIVTNTTPKTGTYAFNLSAAINAQHFYQHSGSISQCRIGLHVLNALASGTRDLCFLRSAETNIVRVQWDATNSQWVVLCGVTEVARVTDVPFATTDIYYHISIDIKVDASAGWVYVWRDGTLVVVFDGDTNDGGTTFDRLHLGGVTLGWTTGSRLDDVVWYDTTGELAPALLPDYRLYLVKPNGNGNYNEWDGSDGNAVDNYLLVDEIPPNSDTDYVTTETANDTESFAMETFTLPSGFSIDEVIPLAVAKKVDAGGTLGLKVGTRAGATDSLSATKTLGTSYTTLRERQASKPGGGAWGQSDLDGMEVVIEAAA